MAREESFHEIADYEAPLWSKNLAIVPHFKIPMAMKPTPIHRWSVSDCPDGYSISVKRDDLTGSTLSGNKVRKLEFILADAKSKGYTDVITSGSTQSNHARTTMIAAKQLGMECHLMLRDINQDCRISTPSGNFLLMQAAEPNIYLLPWTSFSDKNVARKREIMAKKIEEIPGRKVYFIPPGGDTPLGVFGYIDAWDEMMKQNICEEFDDVVVAVGTTGTACGLAIGNYLTGGKLRLHGINVSRSKEMVEDLITQKLRDFGIEGVRSSDIIDIMDHRIGTGYSEYTKEDVDFCKNILKTTGICCDPVYVGKALKGLIKELHDCSPRFKGKRILFIHTGGVFGFTENHVGRMVQTEKTLSLIKDWEDAFPDEPVSFPPNP